MAKPTLPQIFGVGTLLIDDATDVPASITAANPALLIPMTGLAAGLLTAVESMADPEKVLIALLNQATAWYRSDNTEDPIIEAAEVRESNITRRNQRHRGFAYEFTAHQPLPATPTVDPDTIDLV
jgi:hypothetical protein